MTRRTVLGIVLCCLALPPALVLMTATTHHLAGRTTGTMTIAGAEREYIVHVPNGYDPSRPTPLVFSLHGAMNWPSMQMQISQWNTTADRHNFIVAYPGGEGGGPKIFGQRASRTPAEMPDALFIAALIDHLQSQFNIDPARIYANGLSNGGGISHALSCAPAASVGRGRHGCTGDPAAARVVHRCAADAGDCVSRHRRPLYALHQRQGVDRAAAVPGHSGFHRRVGATKPLRVVAG